MISGSTAVRDDPTVFVGGQANKRAEAFLGVGGALSFQLEGPSTTTRGGYSLGLSRAMSSQTTSVAQELTFGLESVPTARTFLTVEGTGNHGSYSQITVNGPSWVDELGPGPALENYFAGGQLTQGFGYELAPRVQLQQDIGTSIFAPYYGDEADMVAYAVEGSLGIQRQWSRFSGRAGVGVGQEGQTASKLTPTLSPAGSARFGTATLGGGYVLTPLVHVGAYGGTFAIQDGRSDRTFYGPAGGARISWGERFFRLDLAYDRRPIPSVVFGGTYLGDRIVVKTLSRFGQDARFRIRTRLVAQRLRTPSDEGPPLEAVESLTGRMVFAFRPSLRHKLELSIGYRCRFQDGGVLGLRPVRDIRRQVVMFTISSDVTAIDMADADPRTDSQGGEFR